MVGDRRGTRAEAGMYEHVTRFIQDIDEGSFSDGAFTRALYNPRITDVRYRETLDSYGLGDARPWSADVESLNLEATLALLTFVHRADYFSGGTLQSKAEDGFLRRVLVRLRDLDQEAGSSRIIGFWKAEGPYGFCSNWHRAGFEFLGTQFATSEHWMMWQKARVMGDHAMEQRILDAPTPSDAKQLGRKVAGFDRALWDDVCEQLVYYGVREKFLANPALASMLAATGSAVLCEASPVDPIWGIGMGAGNPTFGDPSTWKGQNLQGRVCMRVRADVRLCGGELPPREDLVRELLDSPVGRMSLLELSRVPAARPAVLCYARVAAHLSGGAFSSYQKVLTQVQWTLQDIGNAMNTNMGGGFTPAGWDELLVQLAFLHYTGQL